MKGNLKNTGRAASVPAGMITAAGCSFALTLLISGLGGVLISKEWIPQESIGIWAAATVLLSALVGGIVAAERIKRRRLQMAMIHGAVYFLALIGLSMVFVHGELSGVGTILAAVFAGAAAGGLIAKSRSEHRKGVRRKKIHR